MMATLYRRGQDPEDTNVDASFKYRTFDSMPARLKYNMDEMASDTNKGRKKVRYNIHVCID